MILSIAAALAALAALAGWHGSRRSMAQLAEAAERLAAGDFQSRAPRVAGAAGQRLSRALDELARATLREIEEVSREKAQLSAILAGMVEAVVAVDAEGRVVGVNPAFCGLFRVDQAAALGRPFVEILRHARLNELLGGVFAEKVERVDEAVFPSPEERVFDAHALPLLREGRFEGALLVLHDITRLRRLESMRREFVANVSHELRTPLATIRSLAETLRDGALDDKEHGADFVASIVSESERLSTLVEDILDLSAIESGRREPRREDVDLLELARRVVARLKPSAERAGARVEVASGACRAKADAGQMEQVLANLIENALKFAARGVVCVSARRDEKGVELLVEDEGPGIPEPSLSRVFERFYRVDPARARETGGTGLGLSIVKHLVEAHGGRVEARNRPEGGASLRVSLPA